MTSCNSYNYCLSECLTAQVAGYRTYLLYFSLKRGHCYTIRSWYYEMYSFLY